MKPLHSKFNSSIVEELDRAEEDHLRNCPEADFTTRLAALLVDAILSYLVISGLQNLCRALGILLNHAPDASWSPYFNPQFISTLSHNASEITSFIEITSKILFVYFYFVASTSLAGGTAGKLLLGLRVLDINTGKKLGPGRVLIRLLIALIANCLSFGLIYSISALKKDKRTYHDEVTRATVKKVHGVK